MPSDSSHKCARMAPKSKEKSSRRPTTKHHKEDFPDSGSMKSPDTSSPRKASSHLQPSWSYAHTVDTHNSFNSLYQAGSVAGLPSARSWPSVSTVPCQKRLDYDLLGMNFKMQQLDEPHRGSMNCPNGSFECPYHRTVPQTNFAQGNATSRLGGMDRFIAEAPAEQGVVYFRDDMLSAADECCCWAAL